MVFPRGGSYCTDMIASSTAKTTPVYDWKKKDGTIIYLSKVCFKQFSLVLVLKPNVLIHVPSIIPNEAKSILMSVESALMTFAIAISVPPIMIEVLQLRKCKPTVMTNSAEK